MRDQQVRADPHRLPAHVGHEQVAAHDQHDHRRREEGDHREEARVARVADHVARRVDVHDRADAGHQQQQQHRQLVDVEAEVDDQRRRPARSGTDRPTADRARRTSTKAATERHERQRDGRRCRRGGWPRRDGGRPPSAAGTPAGAAAESGIRTDMESSYACNEAQISVRGIQEDPTMRSLNRPSVTMPAHRAPTQTRSGSGIGGAASAAPARPRRRTPARSARRSRPASAASRRSRRRRPRTRRPGWRPGRCTTCRRNRRSAECRSSTAPTTISAPASQGARLRSVPQLLDGVRRRSGRRRCRPARTASPASRRR